MTVETFDSQDKVFTEVSTLDKQPFAAAIYFKEFDVKANKYDIEFSFPKEASPDTNLAVFNPLLKVPDLSNWGKWFSTGSIAIYPYITEFIARSKQENPDFASLNPLFV